MDSRLWVYRLELYSLVEYVSGLVLQVAWCRAERGILVAEFRKELLKTMPSYVAELVDSNFKGEGFSEAICSLVEMGLEAEEANWVNHRAYEFLDGLMVRVLSRPGPYDKYGMQYQLEGLGYDLVVTEVI